jgi:hypothetical protein
MSTSKDNSLGVPLRVLALLTISYLFKPLLAIGLALIALVIIAGLVFLVFVFVSAYFSSKRFNKEYKDFLSRMNGCRFFFYNNRRNSVAFAKETVVPLLDSTTKVVFVDGEEIIACGDDTKFISHMLYNVKEKRGFPYLIKITDSQALDYSVNNVFYNTMVSKRPLEPLLNSISSFYNSSVAA